MCRMRISSLWGKITVFVVICCCSLSAYAKYGGGTGEPNDPYLIYDANQMNAIGADSNDWDKHFKLMADIDLGAFTGTSFNIIGTDYDNPFTGVFDGSGHTISNFTYTSTDVNNIGLFGYVEGANAVIKDLGLIDPNVDAGTGDDVGSLVGINGGTITGCYIEGGSISGASRVGGLVGYNEGTITNCYSTGSVSGTTYVGGLVGANQAQQWLFCDWCISPMISNCYSTGSVTGETQVGGLVGWNVGCRPTMGSCSPSQKTTIRFTITNCYATGTVTATTDVGGLVGENYGGEVYISYSAGSVMGATNVGGLVGSNGALWGAVDCSPGRITDCYSTGSVAGDERVGGLVGYNDGWSIVTDSFWDIETSGQTNSAGGTGKTMAEMQDPNTFMDAGWDFVGQPDGPHDIWAEPIGGGYPILWWQLPPRFGLPAFSGGMGKADDPYLLSTADDLSRIGHNPRLMGAHFTLTNDIDLTGIDFYIIGGSKIFPFVGIFDGNGHTISNFTYDSNGVNHVGLFGFVEGENAEIKDLGLIDSNINAGTRRRVGSLVGRLQDGTISGCCVEGGSVTGDRWVGGLVGYNDEGTISNCYASSSASGNSSVGGLVGDNHDGTVTNSYSTGSVSGNQSVGGLVGLNSGQITNCYSTGSVSGSGNYVGGLVGFNYGTISNCYSAGNVEGTTLVGGLVGANYDYGTITNCYSTGSVAGDGAVGGLVGYHDLGTVSNSFWDIETSGQTSSDGGTGLPTAEMQTAITFIDASWDFNTPVWTIDEGVDYPRLWWEFVPVLYAEPEVTLGTGNTITWDPVIDANDYYAECAEDANFANILYTTGWITETSYEFTGLQLGQRYWYSVKARNIAGVETGWSNVESSLQLTLADAVDILLDPDTLKNKNMKNALLNKINAVQQMLDEGLYADALNKLQNDILTKMNGCAETGRPDKNDWIITCEEQGELYPLVIETIENVKGLMNQ